jgi:hypothetical protein
MPAPAPSRRRLPQESVVRNEFKYDLFGSDLPDVISVIERDHKEIKRPTPATLTLYFYDAELGAPEVDPFYRLRTYAHFDPDATSLDDIKALPWQVQKKCGHEKRPLGTLEGLPASIAPDDEVWELLGETRRPNLLKVSKRRHFAVDETHDESQRITVDLSRSVFKIVDQRLVPLGDIGPRVEVKLPAGQPEDSLPMARRLRGASYWMPFGTMANYFQFLLRGALPMETHMSLPDRSKFAITSGTPGGVRRTLCLRVRHAAKRASAAASARHAYPSVPRAPAPSPGFHGHGCRDRGRSCFAKGRRRAGTE